MASAWGFSFGAAFGNSFGINDIPSVETDVIRNFSLDSWRKWHRPEDEKQLSQLGITPAAAEIIADVAISQAENPQFDEQQRLEHLRGELQLRKITMRSQHLHALNAERQRLIDAEIAKLMKAQIEDEETILLLLAATV